MRKALEPLILSWRVPELRARLLFVLGAMLAYVFALHVVVPNINQENLKELFSGSGSGILGFLDIFGGGALSKLSVLALGIMPYITSSIVFQILTIAFPYFKELQREGEYGRRKMAQWTRWAAIALTLIQASVAAKGFMALNIIPNNTGQFIETVLTLTAGTMFLIWLGEQITEKGIGNGISFIIFAGIVNRLPQQMWQTFQQVSLEPTGWIKIVSLIAVFIFTVVAIISVTQGERRIAVKYAARQAGRRMVQAQRSHLPLKMAAAGVIPIIFAVSIVLFPGQIAQWYLNGHKTDTGGLVSFASWIQGVFSPHSLVASILYASLVMGFTYFYTAVIFDTRDLADNLKKYGGQIQGYAPGRPTQLYIERVLTKITFAGGVFLAAVALMQWWVPSLLGLEGAGGITLVGGTSLLIVVGVALEIMQNLDQQLKMRQYEGLSKQMNRGR